MYNFHRYNDRFQISLAVQLGCGLLYYRHMLIKTYNSKCYTAPFNISSYSCHSKIQFFLGFLNIPSRETQWRHTFFHYDSKWSCRSFEVDFSNKLDEFSRLYIERREGLQYFFAKSWLSNSNLKSFTSKPLCYNNLITSVGIAKFSHVLSNLVKNWCWNVLRKILIDFIYFTYSFTVFYSFISCLADNVEIRLVHAQYSFNELWMSFF